MSEQLSQMMLLYHLHWISGCTICCISSNDSCQKKKKGWAANQFFGLAITSIFLLLLERCGLCYLVLFSRMFPHCFLLLTMSEFSPAGGRKLGLGAEAPASLFFMVGCTYVSGFKMVDLEKMEELNELQQHCKTKDHKRCSFRCELCSFPRAAELVVGESVWT